MELDNRSRRIAAAPVVAAISLALEHISDDYVVARIAHKNLMKWVFGGKPGTLMAMRTTLHDEARRAQRRFNSWEKLPEVDADGNEKDRQPLYAYAALRALDNVVSACVSEDDGALLETVDDLGDIPFEDTTLAEVLRNMPLIEESVPMERVA